MFAGMASFDDYAIRFYNGHLTRHDEPFDGKVKRLTIKLDVQLRESVQFASDS